MQDIQQSGDQPTNQSEVWQKMYVAIDSVWKMQTKNTVGQVTVEKT